MGDDGEDDLFAYGLDLHLDVVVDAKSLRV
jgi:hypothetical protein